MSQATLGRTFCSSPRPPLKCLENETRPAAEMNHDPQPVGVLTEDEQPERFPKLRLTSEFEDCRLP